MEKISPKKKLSLVRYYLSGLSYDEIALKGGVSKGTVANTVADLKAGAFPEAGDGAEQIGLLRELSLELKQASLSPGQCAVGLAVLNRIKECGLDIADIDKWPAILKTAGSDEQAKQLVDLVSRIGVALKKSGMTLEQADQKVQEMEAKAAQLEPVTQQVDERQKELALLTTKHDGLAQTVNDLEHRYDFLDPRVKALEKREAELAQRIKKQEDEIEKADATRAALSKERKRLAQTGFTLDTLAEFNDRTRAIAALHQLPLAAVRERLLHELETLDKGLGLEAVLEKTRSELKTTRQANTAARKEEAELKASVVTLFGHSVCSLCDSIGHGPVLYR